MTDINESKLIEAIGARHSVRTYLDRKIDADAVSSLRALIAQCNAEAGLHIQLVTDEPNAFGKSFFAHYGKFSNVRNYICMVGRKDANQDGDIGYYGEKLVLYAQALGLNTCWVGLSYSKKNTHCELSPGEKIFTLIALGYGATQGVMRKSKTAQQVCADIDKMPDWFRRGVECALLAPTAINQQKFKFALQPDGSVKASTAWGPYSKVDLGIARYHFELGAGSPIKWT